MSCHVTSILSTFYPSMWLNSDFQKFVLHFPLCKMPSQHSKQLRRSQKWKVCPSFSGEPCQLHTKLGRPWGSKCPPTRLHQYLVKCPGTLEVTHFGAWCRFSSFRIKVLKDFFFVLVICKFFSSLNLPICLHWKLHFLHQLQCYFVFPKALPLAFLSLFCFA